MVLQVLLAHLRLDFRAFFSVSANDLRVFKSAENCIYKQGREQLDVMLTRSEWSLNKNDRGGGGGGGSC